VIIISVGNGRFMDTGPALVQVKIISVVSTHGDVWRIKVFVTLPAPGQVILTVKTCVTIVEKMDN